MTCEGPPGRQTDRQTDICFLQYRPEEPRWRRVSLNGFSILGAKRSSFLVYARRPWSGSVWRSSVGDLQVMFNTNREVEFRRKVGQIGSKWDKSVTFEDYFSVNFGPLSQTKAKTKI